MAGVVYAELSSSADLVIIGAGVVGAATAFHASRAGLRPVVIEARPRPCTLTTQASTGAFRLQFDNLEELELVRESVELFLHFSEITGARVYDLGLRQQGYLFATTDPERAEWQRALVERQQAWGQTDIEVLDGDEVRARFPFVSGDVIQARFRAGDGFLDPKALTLGLLAGARAPVVVDCRALGFRTDGGRVAGVETSLGPIDAGGIVICCGPLSGPLAALAGVELPVHTVRRQKLVLPDVPQVSPSAPMTIDDDTGTHWRPALAGAYLLFTDPATPATEPTDQVPIDDSFAFRLLRPGSPAAAARIAPFWADVWDLGVANYLLQAGLYTMTPDHRPLIGTAPVGGLYVNTGYSGHGIMGAPAGSRYLIDVLTGALLPSENPFRLDRTFVERDLDRL